MMTNQNIGLDMYPALKKHLSSSQSANICVFKTEAKGENDKCYRRGDTQLGFEDGWDLDILGRGNNIRKNKGMKM